MTRPRMDLAAIIATGILVASTVQAASPASAGGKAAGCRLAPPVALSTTTAELPDIATGGDTVVAAWHSSASPSSRTYRLMVTTLTGSSWATPRVVGASMPAPNPNVLPSSPSVAANSSGAAAVAYVAPAGRQPVVRLVRWDPASGWGDPIDVSTGSRQGWNPDVSMDADGNAWVAWSATDATTGASRIVVRRVTPSGRLGPRHFIVGSSGAVSPSIDIAGTRVAVAYAVATPSAAQPAYASYTSTDAISFSTPRLLSAAGAYTQMTDIAVAPSGRMAVAWEEVPAIRGPQTVHMSTSDRTGRFGRAAALNAKGTVGYSAGVVAGADGTFLTAWTASKGSAASVIAAQGRRPGSLSETTIARPATANNVAIASAGRIAAVAWSSGSSVWMSRSASGTWAPARRAAGGPDRPGFPRIAVDSAGTATAVWSLTADRLGAVSRSCG